MVIIAAGSGTDDKSTKFRPIFICSPAIVLLLYLMDKVGHHYTKQLYTYFVYTIMGR